MAVALPAWLVVALAVSVVWLVSVVSLALQMLAMELRQRAGLRHPTPVPRVPGRGGRVTLELPPRTRRPLRPAQGHHTAGRGADAGGPRRHSVADIQRSIAAMAVHAWPKDKVIATLQSIGAVVAWSEAYSTNPDNPLLKHAPQLSAAREHVRLRYRPGTGWREWCFAPSVHIDAYFDGASRLVHARAWTRRIRL